MRILVTGGAGFIGSNLVDELIELQHEVAVVDNYITGKKEFENSKANYFNVDISSDCLKTVFKNFQPEIVYHLAAQVDVTTSIEKPLYDEKINISGCVNVLECCREFKVKKVIYSSSAAVYGKPEIIPINESHPTKPLSFYGISKFVPEMYIETYSSLFDIEFTILRYGNAYGPRQAYKGEGGVISIFINKALKNEEIFIYGDGEQTRDFIFVKDIVSANIAALTKGRNEIFNISCNEVISLNNLYKIIEGFSGHNNKINYLPQRTGDIRESWLDNTKAKINLEWKPKYGLKEGINETINYYKYQEQYLLKGKDNE